VLITAVTNPILKVDLMFLKFTLQSCWLFKCKTKFWGWKKGGVCFFS